MPADLRGVARGPGTFDQRTAGMAVARLGDAALSAPLSCRVCCRREAQGVHQLSGVVETGKVAECGHGGHRDRAWHPAEGLERVDDWGKPPGLHLGVECLCQTSQAFGVFGDRANLFLEHDLLGWSRTAHLAEPAQVGGAPGSPARIADIVPQEQRFEPELGGLEIADGIVTGAAQVPDGFILNPGDVDRGQVPRAHQSGQCDGIATVGVDPIPWFGGDQRGSDHPADMAFVGERAVEPIPTRPRFIDKDQL